MMPGSRVRPHGASLRPFSMGVTEAPERPAVDSIAVLPFTDAPGIKDRFRFPPRYHRRRMRDLDLGNGTLVPGSVLRAATSRSGGPGGQNVNKVETRVTIEADVGDLPLRDEQKALVRERLAGRISRLGVLRVTSQAERSQVANRDRALDRMEELLREALVVRATRKRTRTSRAAKQRRLDEKKRRAVTKKLRGSTDD
jgi:ribosome-associated protein